MLIIIQVKRWLRLLPKCVICIFSQTKCIISLETNLLTKLFATDNHKNFNTKVYQWLNNAIIEMTN